jgi:(p)ppGpp synthase/HD superfamily hydrolase
MRRSELPQPLYGPRVADALAFAANAFASRARKGSGVPYLTHLLQVMVTVGEHGGDEDQMIAAVLHDYLEDIAGATAAELEERFGERVTRLVIHLSDSTTAQPTKPPWEERKRAYVEMLRTEGPELKLISAADKLHNATSIVRDFERLGPSVFDRFTASRDQTLWYYRAVLLALSHDFEHPVVEELRAVVARMHELTDTPYPG